MAGFYLRRGEKIHGPIESGKLRELVSAGKVLPTDELAKSIKGPWTQAGRTDLFTPVTPMATTDARPIPVFIKEPPRNQPGMPVTIVHEHKATGGAFKTGFGVALGCLLAVGLTFGGCLVFTAIMSTANDVSKSRTIEQQVCDDAVRQYEIARDNGTAMDAYVQSGIVAAAYLQAKDEANYKKWKTIQRAEARRARVPFR